MKNIYLIVAPSGAGKTTIVESLESKYELKSIQSYTTRVPRYDGETGHIFVSDEEFDKLTDIVAYTEFCGNRYAATTEQVDTHDLYVIDPKGVDFFKFHYKGSKKVKVIYIETSLSIRYERMRNRSEKAGKPYLEAVEDALNRIVNDCKEFYDYEHKLATADLNVNNESDDVDSAVEKIWQYIQKCEEVI